MQDVEAALVPQREVEPLAGAEGVDDVEGVLADGVVQRRVAVRVLEVDVAAVPEQGPHALRVLLVDGHVEGAALAVVDRVDRRAPGQQELHYFRLIAANQCEIYYLCPAIIFFFFKQVYHRCELR